MRKVGFKKMVMIATVLFSVVNVGSVNAQAFGGKGSKQFLIGLGMSELRSLYPEDGSGLKGWISPLSGQLSFQGEFGVGKYVGIGFSIGANFSANMNDNLGVGYAWPYGVGGNSNFWSIGIPVAIISNFHFLQLINDKAGKTFAEKLDVYVGLSLGSGPSFVIPKSGYKHLGGDVGVMIYGGPHAGIRFYPKDKFGIFLELGYGKTYLNGGICFKM
ncbi:hypothetical protein GCM10009118_12760 [Wandonia haliotis]|uniref:Outer membrane protein beta-barrel domain-containing protein n=1 Tax=Wandonia haliotis TaxID=574963 RepID=A0ABN1MNL8_9FLAO